MKLEETERLFLEGLSKESRIFEKKFKIEKLTGDASTRRYYRAYEIENEEKSYVLCLDDPIEEKDLKYSFERVHDLFEANGIRVPHLHYVNREKGFLVEEDLGNITLLEKLGQARTRDSLRKMYTDVLDELVKIHLIDRDAFPNSKVSDLKFDHKKLHDETRITNFNFLIKLLGASDEDPKINIIDQGMSTICKYLDKSEDFVIVHRDFHSRNIMIKNNLPIIIDFQDARLGLPVYDLVSLLEDCYFNIDEVLKKDLIGYYLKKLNLDIESFEKYYDLMTIQRLYKAIGSFSLIYDKRGDARYLKYIGRSFETIILKLSKYEEFLDLRLSLAKIYYAS